MVSLEEEGFTGAREMFLFAASPKHRFLNIDQFAVNILLERAFRFLCSQDQHLCAGIMRLALAYRAQIYSPFCICSDNLEIKTNSQF